MNVRGTIENYIKFIIFLLVTFIGFFGIYAMIWVGVRLPVNSWASLIVAVISIFSEWGYVSWLSSSK